jgi:hypothetical protein
MKNRGFFLHHIFAFDDATEMWGICEPSAPPRDATSLADLTFSSVPLRSLPASTRLHPQPDAPRPNVTASRAAGVTLLLGDGGAYFEGAGGDVLLCCWWLFVLLCVAGGFLCCCVLPVAFCAAVCCRWRIL